MAGKNYIERPKEVRLRSNASSGRLREIPRPDSASDSLCLRHQTDCQSRHGHPGSAQSIESIIGEGRMRAKHFGKNQFHRLRGVAGAAAASAVAIMAMPGTATAATIRMPGSCSSVSACMSSMTSGDTLLIADGTYSGSVSGIKGGTIVQAENDGKVQFTGSFNPGSAGFEMRGIVVKSSDQK